MAQQIFDWLGAVAPALGAVVAIIAILAYVIKATRTIGSRLPGVGHRAAVEPSREELDSATRQLAEVVEELWQREAWRLGLLARLGRAGEAATLSASLIRIGWSVDEKSLPIDADGATNPALAAGRNNPSVDQLADFFTDFKVRTLVILGSAEAGKSAAAILLTLGLLAKRTSETAAVPVKLNLDHWDHGLNLETWLTRRLLEDYPGFRATQKYGEDIVSRLLKQNRLLPILDGLDELPEADRKRVIAAINQPTLPLPGLVVTCQEEQYLQLKDRLVDAVIVKLAGVSTAEAERYLRNAAREHDHPERWDPVYEHLGQHQDGALASALSSPLMLYLVPNVYGGSGRTPEDLLNPRYDNPQAIEEHLLQAFVPAVFDTLGGRPWRSKDASRWLSHLASQLEKPDRDSKQPTTTFGWWELSKYGRPATAVMAGAIGALAGGFSVGLAFTALFNGPAGVVAGIVAGVILGLLSWRNDPPKPSETQRRVTGRPGSVLRSGLAIGAIVFLGGLFARDAYLGLVAGVIFGVPIALLYGLTEPDPTLRPLDAGLLLRRDIRVGVTFGVTYGVPAGITGWLVSGNPGLGIAVGISAALAGALLYGPIWIVAALAPGGGQLSKLKSVGVVAFVHLALATLTLAWSDKLPWRVMAFLDKAHDLGVLRMVSGSYVFRHRALQKVLAAEYAPGAAQRRPGPVPAATMPPDVITPP